MPASTGHLSSLNGFQVELRALCRGKRMNGFDDSSEALPFQLCGYTGGNTARTWSKVPVMMENEFRLMID